MELINKYDFYIQFGQKLTNMARNFNELLITYILLRFTWSSSSIELFSYVMAPNLGSIVSKILEEGQ